MTRPPPIKRRPASRHLPLLSAFAGLVLVIVMLAGNEEAIREVAPGCFMRCLTGLDCAGCGGTRAFFAAARGDFAGSLRMHPLFLPGAGIGMLALAAEWAARHDKFPRWLRPFRVTARKGILTAAGLLVFGLLRNLPWWPFTVLSPP
jgi:hypothetical protein